LKIGPLVAGRRD